MHRREVRWERMFPDELEAAIEACPVVYMPYGLCEPHGAINAVGMDTLRAQGCCEAAARDFGGIVAPPFHWNCHEVGGFATWGEAVIGNDRTWLTAYPPWFFYKSIFYHLRAVDAMGFKAAILFTGHSGPHRLDMPVLLEIIQPHLRVRAGLFIGMGSDRSRFEDGQGMGGHAGRGETSVLWAVAPDCVDLSRMPDLEAPGPHFALGSLNDRSSRRAGEATVRDAAGNFIAKAKELMADYDAAKPDFPVLSFVGLEAVWDEEIRPKLNDWAAHRTGKGVPADDSAWRNNYDVPDLG